MLTRGFTCVSAIWFFNSVIYTLFLFSAHTSSYRNIHHIVNKTPKYHWNCNYIKFALYYYLIKSHSHTRLAHNNTIYTPHQEMPIHFSLFRHLHPQPFFAAIIIIFIVVRLLLCYAFHQNTISAQFEIQQKRRTSQFCVKCIKSFARLHYDVHCTPLRHTNKLKWVKYVWEFLRCYQQRIVRFSQLDFCVRVFFVLHATITSS